MFLLEWQEIVHKSLAVFTDEERKHLQGFSAIPLDHSGDHPLVLDRKETARLTGLYEESTYIPEKLPDDLNSLSIQATTDTGKDLYYFRRLEKYPNWYALDIFQNDKYQYTFLALDTQPFPELRVPFAPFYIPVCILTNKRDEASASRAFEAFKFAHFLFSEHADV